MTPKRVLKTVLSIFLFYHLFAVTVLPMGDGLIIRELGRYFAPYGNLFGLNATWRFFASGTTPSFTLQYSFTYPTQNDDDSSNEGEPLYFPEKKSETKSGIDFYIRRLASVQYFSMSEMNTERYLIPYLCKQDTRAESVTIQKQLAEVQPIERHHIDQTAIDFSEMVDPVRMESRTYTCLDRQL